MKKCVNNHCEGKTLQIGLYAIIGVKKPLLKKQNNIKGFQ